MLHRCYGLAPRARLEESPDGRLLLVGDYPLRRVEVNEAGWRVLRALDGITALDALVEAPDEGLVRFLEDKARIGLLVSRYHVSPPAVWPRVEVIVPVHEGLEALRRCLASLAAQAYPRDRFSVIVVDDASQAKLLDGLLGTDFDGLTTSWRHLKVNMGPGAARNVGAGVMNGAPSRGDRGEDPAPVLAFLDSDCVAGPDWLTVLVSALEDPLVAAVGGRVDGLEPRGWLGKYEAACSSLHMGPRGGPVAEAGGRIPYLPACSLLVERASLDRIGGFRPGLRYGEDVDLCWRLADGGHGLFYLPDGAVRHAHRRRLLPFMQRKRLYARSEAWLRRHHPRHHSRASSRAVWLAVVVAGAGMAWQLPWLWALAAGLPFFGGAVRTWRRGEAVLRFPLWKVWVAGLRGVAAEVLLAARVMTRATLLFWAVPIAMHPPLWGLGIAVFLTAALGEWLAKRPRVGIGPFLVGYFTESLAYSLGRAEGMVAGWWAFVRPPAEAPAQAAGPGVTARE